MLKGIIAAVWLTNGLFAKLLGWVPRHEEIVAAVLGAAHAGWITKAIGAGEVLIALWVVSGRLAKVGAVVQILLVAAMNVLELVFAREHLLWGPFNAVFALLFMGLVFYNGFFSESASKRGRTF